jgi:hypothetical protein
VPVLIAAAAVILCWAKSSVSLASADPPPNKDFRYLDAERQEAPFVLTDEEPTRRAGQVPLALTLAGAALLAILRIVAEMWLWQYNVGFDEVGLTSWGLFALPVAVFALFSGLLSPLAVLIVWVLHAGPWREHSSIVALFGTVVFLVVAIGLPVLSLGFVPESLWFVAWALIGVAAWTYMSADSWECLQFRALYRRGSAFRERLRPAVTSATIAAFGISVVWIVSIGLGLPTLASAAETEDSLYDETHVPQALRNLHIIGLRFRFVCIPDSSGPLADEVGVASTSPTSPEAAFNFGNREQVVADTRGLLLGNPTTHAVVVTWPTPDPSRSGVIRRIDPSFMEMMSDSSRLPDCWHEVPPSPGEATP